MATKKKRGAKKKLKAHYSPKPKKIRRRKKPIVTDSISPIPYPETQKP